MDHERFIRSFDGTEIFVSTSGEGRVPLVLCDGLGCDGFIWRHLKPYFEPRYRVVRWHYRGHGLSKIPENLDNLTVDAIREDLVAVFDGLEIDRAVVFGHSMGCQIILDFAVTHPSRVLGVVPICGSYGRPLETFHGNSLLSAAFPFMQEAAVRWPRTVDRIWRAAVTSELARGVARLLETNSRLVSQSDLGPYFQHLAGMDPRVFARVAIDANEHTVEERLSEVHAPTLIIAGDRDSFTPVWLSRRMHTLTPGSELMVVPGGTHVAPLEIPELLHLRVDRFLEERVLPTLGAGAKRAPATAPAASEPAPKPQAARRRRQGT
jgi:pimeloyl-ACP methyl ester carboxylesterase